MYADRKALNLSKYMGMILGDGGRAEAKECLGKARNMCTANMSEETLPSFLACKRDEGNILSDLQGSVSVTNISGCAYSLDYLARMTI